MSSGVLRHISLCTTVIKLLLMIIVIVIHYLSLTVDQKKTKHHFGFLSVLMSTPQSTTSAHGLYSPSPI